jgi:spore coat protein U-like protein
VSGNTNLVNAGPTDNMPAVITLTLSSSVPCSFNATPIVVNHSGMPIGQNVFVSRRWTVTCNSTGPVTFTLNASVSPAAAFAGSDPDLSNNAGVATDITDVLP